jgi:hypothetical protein
MRNHVSWKSFSGEVPADFDFPDVWGEGENQDEVTILVGPQSTLNGRTVGIPIRDVMMVADGVKRIFIWGWAEYDEVFPGKPRHRTEFFVELKLVGDPETPDFNHLVLSIETRHNGADEECGQRYLDAQMRRPRLVA